ncbi:unnamed protein product, partial [Medioppia subpectinata]
VDYLDLSLVHWPLAFRSGTGFLRPLDENNKTQNVDISVVETWKGMEDAYRLGLTRSIGVSNFNSEQLTRVLKQAFVKPVVNQLRTGNPTIELNPYLSQEKLVQFCRDFSINVVAYCPIGRADKELVNEPILVEIAEHNNKTVAQVMLRWLIQRDIVPIPKTSKTSRLQENINIFDFQLTDDEMKKIFTLNKNKRLITPTASIDSREYPGNKMPKVPSIKLVDGNVMPQIGMGTFQMQDSQVLTDRIKDAINIGYRHIDTAYVYLNERIIGRALSDIFAQNQTKREDLFITSKVWSTFHRRHSVLNAVKLSLNNLGLDYLDLLLIHWPMAYKEGTGILRPNYTLDANIDTDTTVVETWRGMEDVYKLGLTKSIGLSNFNSEQIERILRQTQLKPVINQIETHPYLSQEKLVNYCKARNIAITAYSPLGRADAGLLNETVLNEIAVNHNKTVPQVLLRWLTQREIIIIPKTTKQDRLIENFNVFDFQLTDEEMSKIFALNKNKRLFTKEESVRNLQRVPSIALTNGVLIPQIGLGTYKITDELTAKRIVEEAIEVGYRHIDTAYHYGNERFIGDKLKQLFDKNVIKRDDLFVTTKLWNTFHRKASVMRGLKESLQNLGLKRLDLALIHFPMAFREDTGEFIPVDENGLTRDLSVDLYETWQGMEEAYHANLTRAIGVSNFNITQLQHILKNGYVKPLVNQVEIHPYLTQEPLVNFCHENNIAVVAYSPIAKANQTLFREPALVEMAAKHEKTVPQVIMRWLVQRNIIVIPKTTKKERLIENFNIFDFQLSDEEMNKIFALNKNFRITKFENARYNPNYPFEWPFGSQ